MGFTALTSAEPSRGPTLSLRVVIHITVGVGLTRTGLSGGPALSVRTAVVVGIVYMDRD